MSESFSYRSSEERNSLRRYINTPGIRKRLVLHNPDIFMDEIKKKKKNRSFVTSESLLGLFGKVSKF